MTLLGIARAVCVTLGVLCLAAAATVALAPLPDPAAGGTCGPGTASESPLVAFFDPASIGAGAYPSAASGQRPLWRAFVTDCQSATDRRMAVALGILAGSLLLVVGLPWSVRRFAADEVTDPGDGPEGPGADGPAEPRRSWPPGWYPDPTGPNPWRWWDGRGWGPPIDRPPPPGPRTGG